MSSWGPADSLPRRQAGAGTWGSRWDHSPPAGGSGWHLLFWIWDLRY